MITTEYRPRAFREVIGQKEAVTVMKAVASNPESAPEEAFASMTGYPYVISYMTSYVGSLLAAFVASMTDKVILVPDNDTSGNRGAAQSLKNFMGYNVTVKILKTEQKDFGDVYDAKNALDAEKARYLICSF